MSRRLILVGAGDFAREVIWLIGEMVPTSEWKLFGLIDDYPERANSVLRTCGFDQRVLGSIAEYVPQPSDRFVCTFGKTQMKLQATKRITGRGGQFVNLIHPSAAIGPGCILGRGIVLCRNAAITTNVSLGDHVHLNLGAICGHDAAIGEGSTLGPHSAISGHAVLERGVFLGTNASVMPRVRVGEFSVVGAGSVAFRDVPAGQTVLGVPAKSLLS